MLGAMSQEAAGGGVGARGRDDGEARVCEGVRGVARWCVPVASTTLPFQTVWILWIGLHFVLERLCLCLVVKVNWQSE